MVPMAIPSFGGMLFVVLTTLMVPVLYSAAAEWQLAFQQQQQPPADLAGQEV
jgi:hypothetical protein